MWTGVITNHARERYVTRIINKDKYQHLDQCAGCELCNSLIIQLNNQINFGKTFIDKGLRQRIAKCVPVEDPNFLFVVHKHFPDKKYRFLQDKQALFVIIQRPGESWLILTTVMTLDMIDGTVIKNASQSELTDCFANWKRQTKDKSSNRRIPNL